MKVSGLPAARARPGRRGAARVDCRTQNRIGVAGPFIMIFVLVFGGILLQIPGWVFRTHMDWGVNAAAASPCFRPLLVTAIATAFLWMIVGTGRPELPWTMVGGIAAWVIVHHALRPSAGLKSRQTRAKPLPSANVSPPAAAYFSPRSCKSRTPRCATAGIHGCWHSGLANRWTCGPRETNAPPPRLIGDRRPTTSSSTSSSSNSSAEQRCVDRSRRRSIGRRGGGATWAAAAAGMAAGVSAPSSSSSSWWWRIERRRIVRRRRWRWMAGVRRAVWRAISPRARRDRRASASPATCKPRGGSRNATCPAARDRAAQNRGCGRASRSPGVRYASISTTMASIAAMPHFAICRGPRAARSSREQPATRARPARSARRSRAGNTGD